jgi:protein YibB
MTEITLVTAFFDIGRTEYSLIPRSNDKYFEYFKFWSRLENTLIIYTDSENADRILQIRREFGLEDKTQLIVVEDIYNIEPGILKDMEDVASNRNFIDYRLHENATSNTAKYDYLMLLKSWFLADAVRRKLTSETVAWIDFGFNHGGKVYTNPKEFAFKWEYEFDSKIQLFYLNSYDEQPIFEIVRKLNDCIMGPLIVSPASLCEEFWELNKQSMMILISLGFIDDDQLLMMYSYRRRPEIFDLRKSSWFLGLKEFGGPHLTVRDQGSIGYIKSALSNVLGYYLIQRRIFRYLVRTYRSLKKK